ncbi:hypothetical protein E2C01_005867 [Portunus trituberculatus]|uniref:Uncharacterized protein n=1 Tax=Portunus trituberculatus TaxID=210409 RepID=A0A5B7CXQ7_PORTR|nr:hypothetical protein [Portunus trituberculatus]
MGDIGETGVRPSLKHPLMVATIFRGPASFRCSHSHIPCRTVAKAFEVRLARHSGDKTADTTLTIHYYYTNTSNTPPLQHQCLQKKIQERPHYYSNIIYTPPNFCINVSKRKWSVKQ